MQLNKVVPFLIIILTISFFAINCKHEIPVTPDIINPIQTNNCSPDTVYFANDIVPMINSNCASSSACHGTGSTAGIPLITFSNIRGQVIPFNSGGSKMYSACIKTGTDRMPKPPMPALTQEQLNKMKKWIDQGALNNQCTGGCDSAQFTYSGTISVTINTYCKGCHNPAALNAGIDLSTYNAVKKTLAFNGLLVGVISHMPGYIPMPQGINKLSDCQVNQFKKWIEAGAPDN